MSLQNENATALTVAKSSDAISESVAANLNRLGEDVKPDFRNSADLRAAYHSDVLTPVGEANASEASGAGTPRELTPEEALGIIGKGCPANSGDGINKWTCRAACSLIDAGISPDEASSLIWNLSNRDDLNKRENEITRALAYAQGERASSTPRWSSVSPYAIAAAVKGGPDVKELIARSPEPTSLDGESRAAEYVAALFPSAETWLCCGESDRVFATHRRASWRQSRFGELALVVPSPMTGKFGLTKDNPPKRSQHTLDNTGPRHYLVVEFDKAPIDTQASLHWHLAQYAPLVCVVFSGNKSVHGWYNVEGEPNDRVERFFDYCVSLGADDRTWTRSQFVRMPDGTRADGKQKEFLGMPPGRQSVLYWNPAGISQP